MPTPATRAPAYLPPRPPAPAAPDDQEEDVPPEQAAPAATRARPYEAPYPPTGTTGGMIVQQAGTWDRPAVGRLSADPEQRAAQSTAEAEAQFADKQRADNPFIFSNDIKSLAKEGGRRVIDRAVREGDVAFRDQQRQDRAAANLDTATYNSQVLGRFKGNGQQYYEDPLTKRLVPVIEQGTGRALYHETPWSPSTHPKSGLAVMEKRDRYGQRQFKRPVLADSVDPEDDYIYADMGDGESTPYMTKAQAAQSSDVSLARVGLAALKKQQGARAGAALSTMKADDAKLDFQRLNAEEQIAGLQQQIEAEQTKASDTNASPVDADAHGSRVQQLVAEQAKYQDMLKPTSEFSRQSRISKKTLALASVTSARDAYLMQRNEIAANLRGRGLTDAQIQADPIFQANERHLAEHEDGVRQGQGAIATEEALRQRLANGGQQFETRLAPQEEQQFQQWKQRYAPNDSGADYDFRGAYKAGLTPDANGHWPDTYKKPNHPTFSNESVYAGAAPEKAGSWNGDQFQPPPSQLEAAEPFAIAQKGVRSIGGVPLQEFARRYGDGRNVQPDSLLRLAARAKDIGDTLTNDTTKIDDKLRSNMTEEQNYVTALFKQRLSRLPADQQARVQEATRDSSVWDVAKGVVKSAAGAAAAGGADLLKGASLIPTSPGELVQKVAESTLPGEQRMAAMKADPLYQLGDLVGQSAQEFYQKNPHENEGTVSKALNAAAEAAGGFGPLVASGPAAPLTIGLQTAGAELQTNYDRMIAAGKTPDVAADFAVKRALAGGAMQAALFEILPKPLQKLGNKYIVDKIAGGALKKFLANRVAQGAEGAVLGGTSAAAGNVAADRPVGEGVTDSMTGLALAQAAMPRGARRGGEVPPEANGPADAPKAPPVARTGPADVGKVGGAGDVSAMAAAEAEFQRKLAASDLTPEERTEFERLRAEGEPVEPASLLQEPTTPAQHSALAIHQGLQAEEKLRRSPEGAIALREDLASQEARVADFYKARTEEGSQSKADELRAALQKNQVSGPSVRTDISEAANAAFEKLDALDAKHGVGVGATKERARQIDVIEQARAAHEAAIQPPSNEIPQPVAPESAGAAPEVPVIEPAPAAENVPAAETAVPVAERAEYDRLQEEITRLGPEAVGTPEYQAAWQAAEEIKNRNKGMPPGETSPPLASEQPTEETQHALPISSPESLLQRPPEGTREAGGERGRVEQRVQGEEATSPRVSREAGVQARLEEVKRKRAALAQSAAESPRSAEQRLNDADIGMKPVAAMTRAEKRQELDAAGIKEYKGKSLDDANPAEISSAVGKLRRGELSAEGEKPGKSQPLLTERAEAALQKLKIDTRGQAHDVTSAVPTAAWNAAIDLATVALRAGRPIEQAIRLAIARYKAVHKDASEEDISRLTSTIRDAVFPPEPPKTPKANESKLPESLKSAGAPVESIEYQVRNQEERKKEASAYIKDNGPEKAEAALSDPKIPGDTRVAIGGQLINDKMLSLKDASAADLPRLTRDIQRITARMQPELATEAGQTIAMHSAIYNDVRVASGMEYVRDAQKKRLEGLGGEDAGKAATEAADAFNKAKTDEEKIKAIDKLKEKYTTAPVRRMLDQLKRMETVKELNSLGVLTRDDMVDVAGNALGLPGIDQAKLKHLAELADRIENAKNHAEKTKATLELADTLGIYKGVSALDLESSILTMNVMSGYTTQMGNLAGNTMQAISNLTTTALTNPFDVKPLVKGLLHGIPEGAMQAKSILMTGRGSRDFQDKTMGAGNTLNTVDYARDFPKLPEAVGDALTIRARLVEKIGRAMKAADAVFYYPAREAHARMTMSQMLESKFKGQELTDMVDKYLHVTPEAFESARKQAAAEGYEGIDLARRASDIIEERRTKTPEGKEAVKRSEAYAAETTYNNEPVGLAGVFYRAGAALVGDAKIMGVPILKPWLMFLRVPTNVFNATTNYTPMGAVRAKFGMMGEKASRRNADMKHFDSETRARLYVQSLIGTSMMSALLVKTLKDDEAVDVTASGPDNPAQKAQLMASGWRPYSIKIGGKYVSFRDTPLLMPLAIIGHVSDAVKYKKAKADTLLENKVVDAFKTAPQIIFQTSMLSNFADLMSGLSGKAGATAGIGRTLGSIPANLVIPYNRLLQQIDQTFDDKSYKSNAVQEAVPFARRLGEVQTDVQGRDREYQPMSRFGGSESKDPVDKVLNDRNLYISEPGKDTKLGDKVMTEDQLAAFRKLSGQRIRTRLTGMVPLLRTLDAEKAHDRIDSITREERNNAKEMVRRMPVKR